MIDVYGANDFELLEELKQGNAVSLNCIYKKYWRSLYISAYNILRDKEACEDIIQELFIKLWDQREHIQIHISLKAYLFASTRYDVFRYIRHNSCRVELFDSLSERLESPTDYNSIEYLELLNRVNLVVETLSDKCKNVYKLSREEQLSHKEIALRMQISAKTVENHLTKALKVLRVSLGNNFLF